MTTSVAAPAPTPQHSNNNTEKSSGSAAALHSNGAAAGEQRTIAGGSFGSGLKAGFLRGRKGAASRPSPPPPLQRTPPASPAPPPAPAPLPPPPPPSLVQLAPAAAVLEWPAVGSDANINNSNNNNNEANTSAVDHAVEIREAADAKDTGAWGPWRAAEHELVESEYEDANDGVVIVGATGGAAMHTCRVLSLRPGVRYSVRFTSSRRPHVNASAVSSASAPSSNGGGGVVAHAKASSILPSLALEFETPPTPPAAPQPPALASRSKVGLCTLNQVDP
jgi:hypothetical protein